MQIAGIENGMRFLVTGTGRCGTGYIAKVLQSSGVQCGHEAVFSLGGLTAAWKALEGHPEIEADSSWLAAPFLRSGILAEAQVVHLVRHPKRVVESLLRIGFFDDDSPYAEYAEYAYIRLPELRNLETAEERAVHFCLEWNRMIEKALADCDHVRWRVEDEPLELLHELGLQFNEVSVYKNRRYNSRAGKRVDFSMDNWPELCQMAERYGYDKEPVAYDPVVYWSMLMERYLPDVAVNAALDIAMSAGMNGFTRITVPYGRVDAVRNLITDAFMSVPGNPEDILIMLDCDHAHPADIVTRLASRMKHNLEIGVLGALAFRRSAPFDPMWFVRQDDGSLLNPAEFDGDVYECSAVGSAAIGIKRWVLAEIEKAGFPYPFRYEYRERRNGWRSSEDMYFAKLCEELKIKQFVDCGIETPHLKLTGVGRKDWDSYKEQNPHILTEMREVQQEEA